MKAHAIKARKVKKASKRLGRGYGSGVGGHVVGRGQKGQKSRSGHKSMVFFEGGNVPFYRRIPKFRGFKRLTKVKAQAVNLEDLEKNFKENEIVSIDSLKKKGLIRKTTKRVKILGLGNLTKKLKFEGVEFSIPAKKVIDKLGCEIKEVK